jgi:phosphoribosylglycinamide formyltransferase 2
MKISSLGSGELGKEFTIAAQNWPNCNCSWWGQWKAPAMQVAHDFEVINMLDGEAFR